ncbi:hypothetical protein ACGFNU_23745 [Spirillospora sp. NPDC048911]|uniref:hypothetical protein n=1 Tax=Spirillospora sp. NPDC048911 TaxID=3364527 RepID=UPI00371E0D52
MLQETEFGGDLVDLSELSLRDLGELSESALAHELQERLDPQVWEGDVVASFGSAM